MGSSGGSGSDGTSYTRYASYIEDKHKAFLIKYKTYAEASLDESPYSDYSALSIDDAFLGSGVALTSFASLFSNFELFLQDFDTEALYDTLFEKTVNSSYVKALVVAEGALLNDDVETNALPRITTGARDINSVMSTTFITAKTNLEATRLKALSKYSAGLRYSLISAANDRWKTTLSWQQSIVSTQAQLFQLYFASKMDADGQEYLMKSKDSLWPFTVLDYYKAGLGALQGAVTTDTSVQGASTAQKAISGALSGLAMGASTGNPLVATGAGILGAASAFL